ncbi:hypothetical protein SGPA1_60276 [Streptomyces misionensis JCM 4497]
MRTAANVTQTPVHLPSGNPTVPLAPSAPQIMHLPSFDGCERTPTDDHRPPGAPHHRDRRLRGRPGRRGRPGPGGGRPPGPGRRPGGDGERHHRQGRLRRLAAGLPDRDGPGAALRQAAHRRRRAGRETGHRPRHRQHRPGDRPRPPGPAGGQQAGPGRRRVRPGARRLPLLRHRPPGHHRGAHQVEPGVRRLPGLRPLRARPPRPLQERGRLQDGPARRHREQGLRHHRQHRQQRHRPLRRPRRPHLQTARLRRPVVVTPVRLRP